MNRTVMLVLGWLAATLAAVGIAWAGVQMVSGRVVDPLPPTVPLAQDSTSATDDPTGPTPEPTDNGTDRPTVEPTGATSEPTATADPGTPTRTDPATASATPSDTAQPEVRSYELVGGSVTLRFEPGKVTVLSAVPRNDDFRLDIEGNGTAEVRVEFESDDHRSRVKGSWESGPRDEVEERAEDDDHDEVDEDD